MFAVRQTTNLNRLLIGLSKQANLHFNLSKLFSVSHTPTAAVALAKEINFTGSSPYESSSAPCASPILPS